jgi:hypothetical protein
LYLTVGAYEQGWEFLESRWELTAMQTQIPGFSSRRWDGLRPLDSPLIVIAEQGLGDSIQFVRYLEPLKGDGVEVELLVQPPLVALFQSSFPHIRVRPIDAHIADRSQICPLLSLPLMAQRRSLDQPARSPYLKVDPDRLLKWRRSIDQFVGPKIGVVWRGGSRFKSDLKRSIDLEAFRTIFECQGLNFFSLQKELPNNELQILEGELKANVHNCADQLDDFSDTAALCQCLDLVISVDTAVAHLASALGIQTLILLPFISDWRWGVDGESTAWYPNARLIRQVQHNDWHTVLDEVKGIIYGQFASAHRP